MAAPLPELAPGSRRHLLTEAKDSGDQTAMPVMMTWPGIT
jgi:hypothetical protein